MTRIARMAALACLCLIPALAQAPPEAVAETIGQVSANALAGDVSFLASDDLKGRGVFEPELDIAAEYIASRFRAAGLEPIDGSYFQTAHWTRIDPAGGASLTIAAPDRVIHVATGELTARTATAISLEDQQPVPVDLSKPVKPGPGWKDAVLVVTTTDAQPDSRDLRRWNRAWSGLRRTAAEAGAALVVLVDPSGVWNRRLARPSLLDPENPPDAPQAPVLVVADDEVKSLFSDREMSGQLTVSVSVEPDRETPVELLNVAGLLRGSDPELADTVVLVSAHYDHLGLSDAESGDNIYNGANDDASGIAGVIEVAATLASAPVRPKRSVLFVAFFGEEIGLLGSGYYVRHPLAPLDKTIAALNFEQIGRTDAQNGLRESAINMTGYGYSTVTNTMAEAARLTGIKLLNNRTNSRSYFARSDNVTLARAGIPSHTMVVAYLYPDYHGVGDAWDKIDYPNMAHVVRMLATGVWMLADSPDTPKWNANEPDTEPYRNAQPPQ